MALNMAKIFTYILIAIIVISGAVGLYLINPSEKKVYLSEEVSFQASDSINLSGTFYTPMNQNGPFRVVILIHEFGADRHQWDSFINDFINRDFAVLSYDMRGFGKSENVPKNEDYYDTLLRDAEGAVTWLNKNPNVIPGKIGVVGAQLGGTIAYASSAYFSNISLAVAISPSANVGNLILGREQSDFNPHSILFQFLDTERTSIQPLIDISGEPKEIRIYRPESPAVMASGIALLHRDLRAFGDLLRYLDDNLQ